MMVSNGLAFSPDGRTMYHADTPSQSIRAFDYDAATRHGHRVHGCSRNGVAKRDRPDGAAVDSAGNYWIAFYRGGKVVSCRPRAMSSPNIRCRRCARRCAHSAAPTCARCT